MAKRIVIIGGVAAGMSAAAKARRVNPQAQIIVYERSGYVSYGACGFPYYIKGEITHIDQLLARTPEQFRQDGIQVHTRHEVTAIYPEEKTVEVVDLNSGRRFRQPWDALIVATGGSIMRPPIPGVNLPGVFALRTVEDALAIQAWIETRRPRRAVIVGAGYVGLEMAEALRALGVSVAVLEQRSQVLPSLDADMSALAQAVLERNGVEVYLNTGVVSFIGERLVAAITHRVAEALERWAGDGRGIAAQTGEAEMAVHEVVIGAGTMPAEMVILGMGARPNVQLALAAGAAIGETGAIAVDASMRTSIPGVFAAGAAAEAYHRLLLQAVYMPTAPVASKQGRVAGTNAAGGQAVFAGVFGASSVKLFDAAVAQTGLTEAQAARAGCPANSVVVAGTSRAGYMPGSAPLHVKLVYESGSRRLLGAQMFGDAGVAKRIDIITAALQAGWNLDDLSELDMSYSPPFGPVWDPLLTAANIAPRPKS